MKIIFSENQIDKFLQCNEVNKEMKKLYIDYIALLNNANKKLIEKCNVSHLETVKKEQIEIFGEQLLEKKITIGVSMIVCNEERCISRSLHSILGIVDKIVIVDTGSEDKTDEIIDEIMQNNKTKTKIILVHQNWDDSFSKARNLTLNYMDTDWCLTMDADEIFDMRNNIYLFLNVFGDVLNAKDVFSVCIIDADDGHEAYVPRLFLVRDEIQYVGHVHEELRVNNTPTKALAAPIFFKHDGYSKKIVQSKDKYQRNLRLITMDLENEPNNHRWTFYKIRDQIGSIDQSNTIKQINELLYKENRLKELDEYNSSYDLPLLNLLSEFYYSQNDAENLHRVCGDIVHHFGENSNTLYFEVLSNLHKIHNVVESSIDKLVMYEQEHSSIDEFQPIADNYSHLDFLIALLLLDKGKFKLSINYMNITKDNFRDNAELQRYENIVSETFKYFKEKN